MKKVALALLATLALYAAHEFPTLGRLQRDAVLTRQAHYAAPAPCARADAAFDEIGASL